MTFELQVLLEVAQVDYPDSGIISRYHDLLIVKKLNARHFTPIRILPVFVLTV